MLKHLMPRLRDTETPDTHAGLKRKLVEATEHEDRIHECQVALSALDREADAIAARHVDDCEPIQDALKTLDAKAVTALLAGEPDAEAEAQRRQKLGELESANLALAAAIERINARRKLLCDRLDELTRARAADTADSLRNRLEQLAPEEIGDAIFVQQFLRDLAHGSLKEAEGKASRAAREVPSLEKRVAMGEPVNDVLRQQRITSRRWSALHSTFVSMLAQANTEIERLRAQAIGE